MLWLNESFIFYICKKLRAYEKICQMAADNLICTVLEDDSGPAIENIFFHAVIQRIFKFLLICKKLSAHQKIC